MLPSLAPCMMIVVMLLHAVFGCHWHHGHGCQGVRAVKDAAAAANCGHHHHGGHSHNDTSGEPQAPRTGGCGEECAFLVSTPPTVPSLEIAWAGAIPYSGDADQVGRRAWVRSERNQARFLGRGKSDPSGQRSQFSIWLI